MAKQISDKWLNVFQSKTLAHLATLMPDGSPHTSPVWFDFDGKSFRVNSARGRVKDKNMRRDPRVALSFTDPDNPYSTLMVRGRVKSITEEGADPHIDSLAKRYLDADKYPFRQPGEVRVIYVIEPTVVATVG